MKQKVKEEKFEKKKKEFIKYKLHQHQDVPLGKPYGKEMDPDFENEADEENAVEEDE